MKRYLVWPTPAYVVFLIALVAFFLGSMFGAVIKEHSLHKQQSEAPQHSTEAITGDIPVGYHRVTYSMLQPDSKKPAELIPQSALVMQDKKVFIEGYMQPRRQQTGIKEFVLCPANAACPFCPPDPKSTEMIRVRLQGDQKTPYITHIIRVVGRFRVDPDDPSGIPYGLDAEYLR